MDQVFVLYLVLVIMEVLNEYGAVKYFGVNTFTSGIFRSWYSMQDVDTASLLAVSLFVIVVIFFFLAIQLLLKSGHPHIIGRCS